MSNLAQIRAEKGDQQNYGRQRRTIKPPPVTIVRENSMSNMNDFFTYKPTIADEVQSFELSLVGQPDLRFRGVRVVKVFLRHPLDLERQTARRANDFFFR